MIKKIRAKGLNENFGLPGIDDKNGFKVPKEAKQDTDEQEDMGARLQSGLHSADVDKAMSPQDTSATNTINPAADEVGKAIDNFISQYSKPYGYNFEFIKTKN